MERRALNTAEVQTALADLPGWEVVDGKLFEDTWVFRLFLWRYIDVGGIHGAANL